MSLFRFSAPLLSALTILLCSLTLFGCNTNKKPSIPVEFYLEVDLPTEETMNYTPKQMLSRIGGQPILVGTDFVSVDLARVDAGLCLYFQVTPQASFRLYNISAQSLGKRMVVFINGEPVGIRWITEIIQNGRLFTFVQEVPNEELPALTISLQEALYKNRK